MKKVISTVIFINLLVVSKINAQSLIAGIPSADVAKEKHIMFTHESQVNSWSYDKVKWNSFNFICYGAAKNLEVTLSLSNLSNSPIAHKSLGLGFKKLFDINFQEIEELKFVIGQNVLFSLDESSVGGWTYAMMSNRLPVLNTRLTYGVSYGSAELFGFDTINTLNSYGLPEKRAKRLSPLSFMAGIEQPIIEKKFSIIADWYSGTHDLAALITGVQLEFKRVVLIGGYKFPNRQKIDKGSIIFETMIEF